MKKRFLVLFLAMSMFLIFPAHAVSARAIVVSPSITFNGTEANCIAKITANKPTDKITATMELWQGSTLIDSWSGEDLWVLTLDKTTTVAKNKTYKLVVSYSVNGTTKVPVSITETNR